MSVMLPCVTSSPFFVAWAIMPSLNSSPRADFTSPFRWSRYVPEPQPASSRFTSFMLPSPAWVAVLARASCMMFMPTGARKLSYVFDVSL